MEFLPIGATVLFSHFVEGVSGFGCMILALPVVSAILGLKVAIPLLVVLSTAFDLALLIKDRKAIDLHYFLKIVVFTGLFMPVGFLALRFCSETVLSAVLGIFMIFTAICGLLESFGIVKDQKGVRWQLAFLPLAGIVQGAFGGSGPFIIVYAKSVLNNKTTFRGTMSAVWVVLNTFNLVQYGISGMLPAIIFMYAVKLSPFLAAGFVFGTLVHKRISEKHFTRFVYVILFVSGILMAI